MKLSILKKLFIGFIFLNFCSLVGQTDSSVRNRKDTISEKIQAVEINVNRNLIENQADKLVYNAADDVTSKGSSASDLLAKVPMVEVDMDGNVSMRGNRNIMFLINGRPSGLLSGSPADALRSMSADDIERVEVITNPSSKYDAEGSGGIINIVLKNKKIKGNSGNIRAGLGTRSANVGGQFSTQLNKTNLSIMLGSHFWRSWGDVYTDRINTDANGVKLNMVQNTDQTNWGGGPRLSFNIDHQFNDKNSLVLTLSVNSRWRSTDNSWKTQIGEKDSLLNFLWAQQTDRLTTDFGYDVGFDYRRKFKKTGREFAVSGLATQGSSNDRYDANRDNFLGSSVWKEESLNEGVNREYSMQMDLTEPLTKKLTTEIGIKGILRFVESDYHFDSFDYVSNQFKSIDFRNNTFKYHQFVYAGYLQFNYNLSPSISVRVGTRYELTQFGGELLKPADSKFTGKPYNNLVPSMNISKKIGQGGFVRLNYNRRIQRPSLFYLNPYTNFSDPLNISTGNPYLSPEISDNVELSFGNYTKVGGYGINVYHKRLTDAIETYRTVTSDNVYTTTYGNIGKNISNGFDLNVNFKGKDWMLFFNGGAGLINISSIIDTGAIAGLSTQGIVYSAGLRGNYKISKNWMMEAFARVNAPSFSLQGYSQNWLFHMIGFKKQFKNKKGGLGFGFDNPITPIINLKTENEGLDFKFYERRKLNVWGVRINFEYTFGKITSEKDQPKEIKLKNEDLKQDGNQGGMQ